jgi:hypothetical protein
MLTNIPRHKMACWVLNNYDNQGFFDAIQKEHRNTAIAGHLLTLTSGQHARIANFNFLGSSDGSEFTCMVFFATADTDAALFSIYDFGTNQRSVNLRLIGGQLAGSVSKDGGSTHLRIRKTNTGTFADSTQRVGTLEFYDSEIHLGMNKSYDLASSTYSGFTGSVDTLHAGTSDFIIGGMLNNNTIDAAYNYAGIISKIICVNRRLSTAEKDAMIDFSILPSDAYGWAIEESSGLNLNAFSLDATVAPNTAVLSAGTLSEDDNEIALFNRYGSSITNEENHAQDFVSLNAYNADDTTSLKFSSTPNFVELGFYGDQSLADLKANPNYGSRIFMNEHRNSDLIVFHKDLNNAEKRAVRRYLNRN